MKNKIHISIPSPCHENWAAMTPAEKGRFCASCQKKVHDFSILSDREIIDVLQKNDYVCANASVTQLQKPLHIAKQKHRLWIAASTAILSFLALGNNEVVAQTPVPTEQLPHQINPRVRGKVLIARSQVSVSGIIYDSQKVPLHRAGVIIKGTEISAETDKDGKFFILADVGDVLIIRYIGYKDKYYTVTRSVTNNQFVMEEEEYEIGQVIYHRSFFGRIFHSIGNWFR